MTDQSVRTGRLGSLLVIEQAHHCCLGLDLVCGASKAERE